MGFYHEHKTTIEIREAGGHTPQLACMLSMVIFGTIGVFVRYIPLPSSLIAFVRAVVGAFFILAVMFIKGDRISWRAIRWNLPVLLFSGMALGVNWIFLFEAYRYTTVATATLCYYMAPILIILVSPLVLGEALNAKKICCILVSFLGILLVSGVIQNGSFKNWNTTGVLYGLGAAILYSLVVLLNKQMKGIGGFDRTMVQLAVAGIVLLPYNLLTKDLTDIPLTPVVIVLLLFVGIVHTGIAYSLYFHSIDRLKAQSAAIFSYIDPIVALFLSGWILKEKMDILNMIGAVCILGAAFFSEWNFKRKGKMTF